MPPPDREELNAAADLREALRRFHAATDEITRRHTLTPGRYDLLAQLHASDERLSRATSLAERLHLSRNAVTELVTRAERAGLVVRVADQVDRRSKRIVPTDEGSRRYFAALAELGPERRRLLAILEEVTAHTHWLDAASIRERRQT